MMDRRSQTFQTPNPVKLRVGIPKGRVKVFAEATTETRVELVAINGDEISKTWIEEAEISQSGDEIIVRVHQPWRHGMDLSGAIEALLSMATMGVGGSIEATVHVPLDSAANLTTGSGTIETSGRLGDVSAGSGSGAIRLDACAEARARTGSGEIQVASTPGSVDAKTGSGKVIVGKVGGNASIATGSGSSVLAEVAGEAKVTTGSGHIEVGKAGDAVEAFTASGKIDIGHVDHGHVRAKTVSGKVTVGVAKGTAALLDVSTMSGRVRSDLEPGAAPAEGEKQVELVISTLSGNVEVARA